MNETTELLSKAVSLVQELQNSLRVSQERVAFLLDALRYSGFALEAALLGDQEKLAHCISNTTEAVQKANQLK